ncbi:unnamed protein product [Ostreobium quekettii]|uniref:Uncharacterized protein n=1 Tax=Ostreobium quekettii TaxID=121088 RepID=A0A8S1IVA7_9CHLO|nr:unnamed protein product [Ostreobium quekettii]|eukprot:evm.model.scf_384EXC.6 EVM.evm.TU.scf_384EXC.6   scf_384EXC:77132-79010(-)
MLSFQSPSQLFQRSLRFLRSGYPTLTDRSGNNGHLAQMVIWVIQLYAGWNLGDKGLLLRASTGLLQIAELFGVLIVDRCDAQGCRPAQAANSIACLLVCVSTHLVGFMTSARRPFVGATLDSEAAPDYTRHKSSPLARYPRVVQLFLHALCTLSIGRPHECSCMPLNPVASVILLKIRWTSGITGQDYASCDIAGWLAFLPGIPLFVGCKSTRGQSPEIKGVKLPPGAVVPHDVYS